MIRIPWQAWVIAAVLAVTGAGAVYIYHEGEAHVERQARADTTKAAIVVLDTAQARAALAIARVLDTKPAAVKAALVRQRARNVVTVVDSQTVQVDGQLDTVPPAIVALILADDAKIAADSVHAAAVDTLLPVIAAREAAHAAVDTAMTHQINAGDADGGHSPLVVVSVVVSTVVGLFALLHH